MTTKKFTHAELAEAQAAGNWTLLWQQAIPLVKLVIGRMLSDKDREEAIVDDMAQQGMLIAGEQMRTWKPLECAFSTHITRHVQWYIGHALAENNNGGIGSRAQKPVVLSLGDDRPDAESASEEDREDNDGTFDAALTYAGVVMRGGQYDGNGYVPKGFRDPSEEADTGAEVALRAALQHLTAEELDLVSTIYGLGGGQTQTLADYAEARHMPLRTAERRMANIRAILAVHLQNLPHS